MRVTHVITRLIVGGAQENTVASVLGLRRRFGLAVELVAGPSHAEEGSLQSAFAEIPDALTLLPHLVRPVRPWHDFLALRQLTNLFRQRRPDIVHTHSGKAGVLGRLAARRAGVPVIIHTIHGPSFGSFQGPVANALFTAAERRAARCTTHFVVVANAMTRQYLAAGIGQPGQFTRIFSGFKLDPFLRAPNDPAVRARWGLAPDDFVVGKIARLTERKGHGELLTIAPALIQQCPRLKFLLIGGGPWRARLEARAAELGLRHRVVFTGLVPPSEVPALVGVMDALVHLSTREGLPRALPQALAAGKPVLAYDCDGAGEICVTGETGFLIPPGHARELSARLLQIVHDPTLRLRLGETGRQRVRQHFSEEQMVDDLHALYQRLGAVHRPGSSAVAAVPLPRRSTHLAFS